jgi:arylsulfatase A-like enzyme
LAIDLIHGYYATVSYTDALIGEILKELETQKLSESTLVILVSDHGYNLQEHTQWAKFTNYNTSTQVPLIIYNPLSKRNGSTNALTSLIDIYPTLVELCGFKAPKEQLDGTSLVPILKNPELEGRKHVLIKRTNGFTLKTKAFSYTEFIRMEDNSIQDKMLYDHRENKVENTNVVYKKEFQSIAAEMRQTLHSVYQRNFE